MSKNRRNRHLLVLACLLLPASVQMALGEITPSDPTARNLEVRSDPPPAKALLPPERLESLVAPVALYPDPLLAQVLAASTYPLELVEASQWLAAHPDLEGEALTKAARKENWDPSVQALVAFPDVLKRMTENVKWTTDLGDAYLAQEKDVMDAVQRLRLEAKEAGKLESCREQEVRTKVVEKRTVVEIVPEDPEIVYVPAYDPVVIWGAPVRYDYPVLYYPPRPSYADYWISFGAGVALGCFFSGWNDWYYWGWPSWGWGWGWPYWSCGGGWGWNWGWGCGWGWSSWGWGCHWGYNGCVWTNGHFCNRYGYYNGHHGHPGGHHVGPWRHDPHHRGGVPYRNSDVARRYGSENARGAYTRGARSGTGTYSRADVGRGAGRSVAEYRANGAMGDRSGGVRGTPSAPGREGAYRSSTTGDRTGGAGRSTYSRSGSTGRGTASDRYSGTDRGAGTSRATYNRSGSTTRGTASDRYASTTRSAGSDRSYSGSRSAYNGRSSYGDRSQNRGYASSGRSSYSGYASGSGRSYPGSRPSYGGSSYGGRSYGGGYSGGRSYSGGSSGGRSYSGGYSGGRSYSGGSSGGRSYSGGSSGGRSGGGSFGGGRSGGGSSGGGRSGGGGGSRR